MKIKEYNQIKRVENPKWQGWKILDFYNSLNINICNLDDELIKTLEENYILIKEIEKNIEPEIIK